MSDKPGRRRLAQKLTGSRLRILLKLRRGSAMPQPPGAYAHSTTSTSCPPTPTSKRSGASTGLTSPKRAHKRRRKMDERTEGRNEFEDRNTALKEPEGDGLFGALWKMFQSWNLGGSTASTANTIYAPRSTSKSRNTSAHQATRKPSPPPRRSRPDPPEADDVDTSSLWHDTTLGNNSAIRTAYTKRRPMYSDTVGYPFGRASMGS